jgi:hypothetical protein
MLRTLSWSLIGADLAALKIERSLRPRMRGDRRVAEGSPLDRSGAQLKDDLAGRRCLPAEGSAHGTAVVSSPTFEGSVGSGVLKQGASVTG